MRIASFRSLLLTVTLLLLVGGASSALSAPRLQGQCTGEQEPNNTAPEAQSWNGSCLEGVLDEDDAQDLWRWTIAEADSSSLWRLTLSSPPEGMVALEIFAVTWADNGEASSQTRLVRIESLDGSGAQRDVILNPGDYILGLGGAGVSGGYQLTVEQLPLPANGDSEPNDRQADASPATGQAALSGVGDNDWYVWTLPPEIAQNQVEILLQAPLNAFMSINLYDAEGNPLVSRSQPSQPSEWRLHDLLLPAGDYLIQVNASSQGRDRPYVLSFLNGSATDPLRENEPNNLLNPLPFQDGVQGRQMRDSGSGYNDVDAYWLTPEQLPAGRKYDLILESNSVESRTLCLYSELLVRLHCRDGSRSVTLVDLARTEERLLVVVDGRGDPNETYTLRLEIGERLRPHEETEPNDSWEVAPLLPPQNAVVGRFAGPENDVYRFVTTGPSQLWRIQAMGDMVSRIELQDAAGRTIAQSGISRGDTIRLSDLELLPGTHYIFVRGNGGDYVVRAISQGAVDRSRETEPNNDVLEAMPLPFGEPRRGILPASDVDNYRFRFYNNERVRITVTPPDDGSIRLDLSGQPSDEQFTQSRVPGEANIFEGELLPGDYILALRQNLPSDTAYTLLMERLSPFAGTETDDFSLAVSLSDDIIAPYSLWWQRLEGEVEISGGNLDLDLDAHISHASWEIEWGQNQVSGSGLAAVPFSLLIPPDVPATSDIFLTVRGSGSGGQFATGAAHITPNRTASPVNAHHAYPVDDAALGLVNAASLALGSTILTENGQLAELQASLHSQTMPGQGHLFMRANYSQSGLPLELSLQLAGDAPLPVQGIALHPQGAAGTFSVEHQARAFELLLSADGNNYQAVLEGELDPFRMEQFFILDAPVPARYAMLRLLSNYGHPTHLVLDE